MTVRLSPVVEMVKLGAAGEEMDEEVGLCQHSNHLQNSNECLHVPLDKHAMCNI